MTGAMQDELLLELRALVPAAPDCVGILDQTELPWRVRERRLDSLAAVVEAIRTLAVRGAPLIGAAAAFGCALALSRAARADDGVLAQALATLAATRPTAVNLQWALARMAARLRPLPPSARAEAAWAEAQAILDEDAASCAAIGRHGLALLLECGGSCHDRRPLQIMTHCNAGWLATAAYGTALAPVYAAHARGVDMHVWVSETRPRNQGLLTAWELARAGVAHTLVADSAAGWLLATGQVDIVLVGADRIATNGDVANKIGTYLKALAAGDRGVPFCVAAPIATIDWACTHGDAIPIEARDGDELRWQSSAEGPVRVAGADTAVANPAFDITPARLVTAIISERGIARAARLAADLAAWRPGDGPARGGHGPGG
ncbi:MAG: methylthioribose-1-phosphate isomerase [Betaproteobacteria bacterium]